PGETIWRMNARRAIPTFAIMLLAGIAWAQFRSRQDLSNLGGGAGHLVRIEGGLVVNEDELRTAREVGTHSSGTPDWTNAPGFEDEAFTFTRVIFQSDPSPRPGRRGFRFLGWRGDF